MPKVLGKAISRALSAYYLGPDHPMKMRIWYGMRRLTGSPRLTIPYAGRGWITVDERDMLQREILVNGAYEPEVWESLAELARGGEVVWDIGANIGSFAVRALNDPRVAEVHAFEPDPISAEVLETNLGLNRGRYVLHRVALSSTRETRALHHGPTANTGISGFANTNSSASFEVRCETLDSLVFDHGLPAPTLVKIDVEGWEAEVLRGAARLLATRPPRGIAVELECDAEGRITDRAPLELLEGAGYEVRWVRRRSGEVEARENYLAVQRAPVGR